MIDAPILGLLLTALWAGSRSLWISGRQYQDALAEQQRWREMAMATSAWQNLTQALTSPTLGESAFPSCPWAPGTRVSGKAGGTGDGWAATRRG